MIEKNHTNTQLTFDIVGVLLGRLLLDSKFEGMDVGSSEAFNFALRRSS